MTHYSMFRVADRRVLFNFIVRYPFATVAVNGPAGGCPVIATVPVIRAGRRGMRLQFHIARGNPAFAAFSAAGAGPAALTFIGPNAPVSPSWYRDRFADGDRSRTAPTWDYAAVTVTGRLSPMSERGLRAHLRRLTGIFEGADQQGWRFDEIDPVFLRKLGGAIAGFDVAAAHMEGLFKLSQEQSAADRVHIRAALEARGCGFDRLLAGMIPDHG